MKTRSLTTLTLSALALATASFGATAATFSNGASIAIPAEGTGASTGSPASPYASTINVSGLTGNVTSVTVTLNSVSHTFPADIDILLVAPNGQQVLLMSDMGGGNDINGVNLSFSATASAGLPTPIVSGTYLPSNNGFASPFPAPAPSSTSNTDLSVFNGPAANANGIWSLYVVDDAGADVGSIAGGWALNIASGEDEEPETTCASEGYTGTQLTWCMNICEKGYTGVTLDMWIRRWMGRWHDLPYCTREEEEEPPQEQPDQ